MTGTVGLCQDTSSSCPRIRACECKPHIVCVSLGKSNLFAYTGYLAAYSTTQYVLQSLGFEYNLCRYPTAQYHSLHKVCKDIKCFAHSLKVLKDKPGEKTSRQLCIDFTYYTVHSSSLLKNAQDVCVLLDYLLPRELICFSPIGYQHLQFTAAIKFRDKVRICQQVKIHCQKRLSTALFNPCSQQMIFATVVFP